MSIGGGRCVLVTGCSSGIGWHAAQGLRDRGYRVFATARRPEDVEKLREENLEAVRLDLDEPSSIQAAWSQVRERCEGRLYALFNNAGNGLPGAVEDVSREALRRQLETNLLGPHELTRLVLPDMRRAGAGRIVHNGSALALVALPYRGAYLAAKCALEGLTDTLRLELDGSGVQVSLLELGPTESGFRRRAHAAFLADIDREASAHREAYARLERQLADEHYRAPLSVAPEAVLPKLYHALESPRPRPRYYVGVPSRGLALLRRLPTRWIDAAARAIWRRERQR